MITTYFYSQPANTKHLYNIYTASSTLVHHCINVIQMCRVCRAVSSPDLPYASTVGYFELSLLNIIRLTSFNDSLAVDAPIKFRLHHNQT